MSEQKALGQVNLDAWLSARKHRPNLPISDAQSWEAAASAVREQVIQDAIKAIGLWYVTIQHTDDEKSWWYNEGSRAQIEHSLSLLRSLLPSKDSQLEEGGK